ncbi:MAG: PIN domain-containing protein [Candidatus Solibacter usitatus]|nr:PIN domain-containing protein [Candidatus Solibacter usitatus]
MLNLDTHILVFAMEGELSRKEKDLLRSQRWGISSIVLWELSSLVRLGRITLDIQSPAFENALSRIHVWPIDLAVCRQLRFLDFKSDPADEIIAATSVVNGAPLVTRDRRLLSSQVVPLAER